MSSMAALLLTVLGISLVICVVGLLLSDTLYYICDASVEFIREHKHAH